MGRTFQLFHKTFIVCLLVLGFTFSHLNVSGQIDQKTNHIFVWDVTQSMKGYNGAPDIYQDVVDLIVRSLNNIEADGSDIYIIPFKDKVLQTYYKKATPEGIASAIDFVQNFEDNAITYTNICIAWERAIELVSTKNKNMIYLLTDGKQNSKQSGYDESCLLRVIDQYCALANNTDNTYTFYISFYDKELPSAVKNKLKNSCPEHLRFIEGTPPTSIIDIHPTRMTQVINLKEGDLTFTQRFDASGPIPDAFKYNVLVDSKGLSLPAGVKLRVKNNQGKQIINGQTSFELDLSADDLKRLRDSAPEEMTATVYYIKQDLNKLGLSDQIIEFTPDRIQLKIRNKREKILKITVLDE